MVPKLVFTDGKNKGEMLFFLLYRMHAGSGMPGSKNTIWKPVYKSELKASVNRNQSEFVWNQFSVMVADICGSDYD